VSKPIIVRDLTMKSLRIFVHRGAEMDVGVRVWRAVVHDELRAAFAGAANEAIEIELVPFLQSRWLALREIGLSVRRRSLAD
jgi:hypothetical protein